MLTLHGVLYVPQLRFWYLLSTECLRRETFIGYDSLPNMLYFGEDEEIITIADSSSGIPIINTNPYSEGSSALLPCQKGRYCHPHSVNADYVAYALTSFGTRLLTNEVVVCCQNVQMMEFAWFLWSILASRAE